MKRTQPDAPPQKYAVLVLYLSGDDDYGALHAKDYGLDRLVSNAINEDYPTDSECSEDFNVHHELWVFPTTQSRSDAIELAKSCRSHVIDYDGSKHTDTHIVALSDEEYTRYLAHRSAPPPESPSDSSEDTEKPLPARKKTKKSEKSSEKLDENL